MWRRRGRKTGKTENSTISYRLMQENSTPLLSSSCTTKPNRKSSPLQYRAKYPTKCQSNNESSSNNKNVIPKHIFYFHSYIFRKIGQHRLSFVHIWYRNITNTFVNESLWMCLNDGSILVVQLYPATFSEDKKTEFFLLIVFNFRRFHTHGIQKSFKKNCLVYVYFFIFFSLDDERIHIYVPISVFQKKTSEAI